MRAILASVLFAAAATSAPAAAQQLGPGSNGKASCYEVRSAAPFTILTHVILPDRTRSVARIDSNQVQRHCIAGQLFPDGRVNFRIVSGLGPPLFSCQTRIDKPIFVSGRQDAGGSFKYDVTCY
ncbi:MAG TPA: hypothetical protein VGB82_22340 [Alphaproteobacteria bacterium]